MSMSGPIPEDCHIDTHMQPGFLSKTFPALRADMCPEALVCKTVIEVRARREEKNIIEHP